MEIKEWTYEEYPAFDEYVEGAERIPTSGDEVGTYIYSNVEYANVYNRLKQCGKDVKLYLLEGADHGGSEFWTEEVQEIVAGFMGEQKALM